MTQCDFVCKDCKKAFSKILEETEYKERAVTCPQCGSRQVAQQVLPFDSREPVNLSASEEDDRARALSDWEEEGGASGARKFGKD
jgi:DNA-directed RNA polymerase subunit RPC12/RpoP